MFNLEKFQAEFKTGRFDEFHYYSTLAKELTRMKETVSIAHLSVSRAAQLDSIAFDRFVNITGEKNNFECSLLIDTETGYLYSPQWFNTNNRTFATIHDYETFVAQQVIAGFNDWELVNGESFIDFSPEIRIKWFDSKKKNKVINKGSFYYVRYKPNVNDPNNYKTFIAKFSYLNSQYNTNFSYEIDQIEAEFFFFGNNEKIKGNFRAKTYYDCSLLTPYFPEYLKYKTEKIYQLGEAYPFIYSRRFVDQDIWGNKFSAFTFIQFLVDNDFDTSFLPKAPNLIPYILETLQKTTGIRLHEDSITFPSHFFKHESAISKHQNLIAYLDFLLWKIEYYAQSHATELTKSNQLYSQLANLKTDNAELNNIQQYLLRKFDFSLQNLEEKLLQFKSESIAYLEKIDCVDSVWQYAENQPSLDFNLIGEAITRLI